MTSKLSETARETLRLAMEFAREPEGESVETEHLLLALLTDADPSVVALLADDESGLTAGAVIERIVSTLRQDLPAAEAGFPRGRIPLSPITQQAIVFAEEVVERIGSEFVEPRHLLLGLLLERRGRAFRVLHELGVSAEAVQQRLEPESESPLPEPAVAPNNGSHEGLIDRLISFESGLTYRERAGDSRVYVPRNDGWQAHIKRGWEKLYCYLKHPGDEAFHLILNGEVYLQRGDEKYCLDCALRHEFATRDRLYWQRLKREKQTE